MKKKKTTRFLALTLSALLLPVVPFSAGAEETVVKDFSYFAALDDYQVYVEYCEAYNALQDGEDAHVISDTLPAEEALPLDSFALQYVNFCDYYDEILTLDVRIGDHAQEIIDARLGMSSEERVADLGFSYSGVPGIEACLNIWDDGSGNARVIVDIAELMDVGTMDLLDFYRVFLAVYNSGFYQTYGEGLQAAYSDKEYSLGDANADSVVDATDASLILGMAALCGSGYRAVPSAEGVVACLADINKDGMLDARDANQILILSAEAGVQ